LSTERDDLMFEWSNWWGTLAAVGIVVLANVLLAVILMSVKATAGKRVSWLGPLIVKGRARAQLLLLLVGLWIALGATAPSAYSWWPMVSHLFLIVVVLAGALVLSGLTTFGFTSMIGRFSGDELGVPHVRRMQTQLKLIRRLVNALIGVIALGVVLFSFPEVRAVGTSVLASAGILSLVAGLAAQSTLGNLVAGIQLVFSNAIRVGDVVVVEGEYGTIGEITLSYVVVNVWDERRLILPCTYFTNQPFEIWTRNSALITGTVYLDVDWRVPLAHVRAKFMEVVTGASELWDGRTAGLIVADARGGYVSIRFTVTAEDADKIWALRCLVREEMVTWLQGAHPDALPVTRVVLPT
jgi:small-conductance mechanosensitive channel